MITPIRPMRSQNTHPSKRLTKLVTLDLQKSMATIMIVTVYNVAATPKTANIFSSLLKDALEVILFSIFLFTKSMDRLRSMGSSQPVHEREVAVPFQEGIEVG